jgi:hypothetical protein
MINEALAVKSEATTLVVSEETGRPYLRHNFEHVFAEFRYKAGLPAELWFADLRRSGMTEGADAGATDDELRGQSGHKTRNVVAVYVRSTQKQAGNAIGKTRPTSNAKRTFVRMRCQNGVRMDTLCS